MDGSYFYVRSNRTQPYTNALLVSTVPFTRKRNIFNAGNSVSYFTRAKSNEENKVPEEGTIAFRYVQNEKMFW